ncbi:MAG: hypothetical protein AB8B87_13855 [Granulosicoccus sp.]
MMRMGKQMPLIVRLLWLSFFYILIGSRVLANDQYNELEVSDQQLERPKVLQGKRLFFEPEKQRLPSETAGIPAKSVDKEERSKVVGRALDSDDDSREQSATSKEVVPSVTLQYDAYIKGERALHIVVNGKLCNPFDLAEAMLDRSQTSLVCSSLDKLGLTLRLLPDEKSIRVFNGTLVVGVLTPGRKL